MLDCGADSRNTAGRQRIRQQIARQFVNGAAIFLKMGTGKFPSLAGWRSAVCVIGASIFRRPATAFEGLNGIGGCGRFETDDRRGKRLCRFLEIYAPMSSLRQSSRKE